MVRGLLNCVRWSGCGLVFWGYLCVFSKAGLIVSCIAHCSVSGTKFVEFKEKLGGWLVTL